MGQFFRRDALVCIQKGGVGPFLDLLASRANQTLRASARTTLTLTLVNFSEEVKRDIGIACGTLSTLR